MEIRHLKSNPQLLGLARLIPDIVYSKEQGEELTLDLLVPWTAERPDFSERYPLIVFIQGSSWTRPDRGYEIPQLSAFARQGYVVVTVGHRSIFDGHPFPAFLEDVKCAIRFLRANAQKYSIDGDRVGVWGTSSGGNAAMLMGLTGDCASLKTNEYSDYSDAVQAVVSCFGPTDIADIISAAGQTAGFEPILHAAFGDDERLWPEIMDKYSPIKLVRDGENYPPFLLLHGNADLEVSFHQMLRFAQRLDECGAQVSTVCVDGAGHEWDFWSESAFAEISSFLDKQLKTI